MYASKWSRAHNVREHVKANIGVCVLAGVVCAGVLDIYLSLSLSLVLQWFSFLR